MERALDGQAVAIVSGVAVSLVCIAIMFWVEPKRTAERRRVKSLDVNWKNILAFIIMQPRMWAYTKEAYIAQLALLLNLKNYNGKKMFEVLRKGSIIVGPEEPLTDDFIVQAVTLFGEILKEGKK